MARDLLSKGAHLGFSSKGNGKVVKRGDTNFVENYDLHSVDLVSSASVKEATAKAIVESLAADSLAGHSLAQFKQAFITNAQVRDIVASIGKPELLAAFDKYAVDFDSVYGTFQNPNSDETFPNALERTRFELIRKLIDVNQRIASQDDEGLVGAGGTARNILGQYSKKLAAENDVGAKYSVGPVVGQRRIV